MLYVIRKTTRNSSSHGPSGWCGSVDARLKHRAAEENGRLKNGRLKKRLEEMGG
jgi:hypothetical protein